MSSPIDDLRARVEQAQALAAAAPAGPWEWSVYAGRHPVRLCTESQFQAGSGYLLQLDIDRIPDALASLIEAAPDLVALVADLWAAYATRAQDASVAVARACLERDEARKERDAAVAEVVDFMREVVRRRLARQENARYCTDRLSGMDADALRTLVMDTASELDDVYAAFDRMASISIRADLQRAEMRAERDTARAMLVEVATLAGEREPEWDAALPALERWIGEVNERHTRMAANDSPSTVLDDAADDIERGEDRT